jgi:hypothetical protein
MPSSGMRYADCCASPTAHVWLNASGGAMYCANLPSETLCLRPCGPGAMSKRRFSGTDEKRVAALSTGRRDALYGPPLFWASTKKSISAS